MAPCWRNSRIAATPDRAIPTTTTLVPSSLRMSFLSQLQSRQREQSHHQSRDPKAGNDLRFFPAQLFEMMMDRRHLEDPLLAQLVTAHLQNYRQRFDHVDTTDENEQDFLLDQNRNDTQRSAQRQRSHVAHENLGRMRVVPKESERCAHHGAAE